MAYLQAQSIWTKRFINVSSVSQFLTAIHIQNMNSYRHMCSSQLSKGFSSQPAEKQKSQTTKNLQSSISPQLSTTQRLPTDPMYDVFVVGGGVTGTGLLYLLSNFTNLKRLGLAERRDHFGSVASGALSNSQTIHCGDIETNYTQEKAMLVKKQADMLRNFATKLPDALRDRCVFRMPKMVIGIGNKEIQQLEQRYTAFRDIFPNQQLLTKEQLSSKEPHVIQLTSYRTRPEPMNALFTENEHTGVNYNMLSNAFIEASRNVQNKTVDVTKQLEVEDIISEGPQSNPTFILQTSQGRVRSKFVVVSSCGYSLLLAHKLGYGLNYGCLPVAGSFYYSRAPVLNGKVYTVQDPKLPFAAIHGDPDVYKQGFTRFGPTALPLPLLERDNWKSLKDFLTVSRIDRKYLVTLIKLFADPVMLDFSIRNFIYELPFAGSRLFLKSVHKLIPSMRLEDLRFAHGCGGIRPQLIDKVSRKLLMGEGKIKGENIIFNITPSPGGTTCLGNAEKDMRHICESLGATISEEKLKKNLFEGLYPVH